MAYVPDSGLNTMETLNVSLLNADGAAQVTGAKALDSTNVRDDAVFSSEQLEFPTMTAVVSDHVGHRFIEWWRTGSGKPIVWENDKSPDYQTGTGGIADFGSTAQKLYESQNFIATMPPIPVPAWTYATAATPKWRLKRIALTLTLLGSRIDADDGDEHIEQMSDHEASDTRVVNTFADLCRALIVRVHRIPHAEIRAGHHTQLDITGSAYAIDLINDNNDAWKIGEKTGMTFRGLDPTYSGMVTQYGMHPKFDGHGSDYATLLLSSKWNTFHATCLLGENLLSQNYNLAPGDDIIVSVTGTDLLINSGEPVFNPDRRNIVLPPRGSLIVPVFESGHCK